MSNDKLDQLDVSRIEKGVPMADHYFITEKCATLALAMEIGDSIVLDKDLASKLTKHLSSLQRLAFVSPDRDDSWRVWRTK